MPERNGRLDANRPTGAPGGASKPRLSHSSVNDMLSCPKKYQLRKIVQVEERPGWAALGGKAVHAAVEKYERLRYAKQIAPDFVAPDE